MSLCLHIVGIASNNDVYILEFGIILLYLSQNWSLDIKPPTLFTISFIKHTVRIGGYTYSLQEHAEG